MPVVSRVRNRILVARDLKCNTQMNTGQVKSKLTAQEKARIFAKYFVCGYS